MKKNNNAFTLIELLITLSVASLLITVAIPFMGSFVASNSAREATSLMELDLLYARNTAVSREVTVEITPVDDEFENGWQKSNRSKYKRRTTTTSPNKEAKTRLA